MGLEKHGKGDWRSISRNFVISRTPTQVASHAQKYFIRLNSENKERRRSSIHDITSIDEGDASTLQGPITGQKNETSAGGSSSCSIMPPQPHAHDVGVFVPPAVGQSFNGPVISTVGTPMNLPYQDQMMYGVREPTPGPIAPDAPTNNDPMTFLMPHSSDQK